MSNFVQPIISFLIVFPIVIFLAIFFISVKIIRKPSKAFGHAADITTILLFFAVPIAIQSLFQIEAVGYMLGVALIISIILTVVEWKSKTEIELLPLLRKIWRFLFLVLSLIYFVVWCLGVVLKVLEYIK
ncbi:DUF3397 domain-containing protein [Paenisporosarcina sp. TG20]|uniref:DUF3397 domain-containing protein n=1 Tax=Paenisporosarcina sp. TG20 TaxID=1211706 RepID=UPI0002DB09FA|nr:DUF3397 domain-containing protein [Paenisporosarcina sp. TG20]